MRLCRVDREYRVAYDGDYPTVPASSSRYARQESLLEENRFDDMAKALGPLTTRRLTLGALLGGALSALGLGEADAARSGKCKRNPGECETCQKGKCQNKNGKKTCRAGKIKPKANGTACSVGTCQDGGCACPSGRALCGGVCQDPCPLGQQRDPSSCVCCKPSGTSPCTIGDNPTCCSGFCFFSTTPPFSLCT